MQNVRCSGRRTVDATVTNGGEVLWFPPLTYSVPCSDDDANDEISCSLKSVTRQFTLSPSTDIDVLMMADVLCDAVIKQRCHDVNVRDENCATLAHS